MAAVGSGSNPTVYYFGAANADIEQLSWDNGWSVTDLSQKFAQYNAPPTDTSTIASAGFVEAFYLGFPALTGQTYTQQYDIIVIDGARAYDMTQDYTRIDMVGENALAAVYSAVQCPADSDCSGNSVPSLYFSMGGVPTSLGFTPGELVNVHFGNPYSTPWDIGGYSEGVVSRLGSAIAAIVAGTANKTQKAYFLDSKNDIEEWTIPAPQNGTTSVIDLTLLTGAPPSQP